jgi:hypothetical protein
MKPRRYKRCRKPEAERLPEERIPAGTVYVGRPTKWGNPFPINDTTTREKSVALFEDYLRKMPAAERERLLAPLRGKDLSCWCHLKEACHADVLLRWANSVS